MENFDHFRSEAELKTGVLIWQIMSPVLILFGTTGNVMSIIVLSKRSYNRWASSVFLIGLSVADLSMLYVGLLRQWVKYTFEKDIRFVHPILCKVHWWLMYVCADIPVWILTAITVERLVSTLCPYRSKVICSKNKAILVLGIIVSCALVINSHLLYGFGQLEIPVENGTLYIPCAPLTANYEHFFGNVWPWIDLCKFFIIPFAILSSGNVCIIYKLVSHRWKVRVRIEPSNPQRNVISTAPSGSVTAAIVMPSSSSRKTAAAHSMSTTAAPSRLKATASSRSTNTASNGHSADKTSNMSILLVCLNFAFVTSTLPVCIYFIGEPYWIPADVPRNVQLQDPWWALVNMFMYVNNSANFIMYCLTGSRFRSAVRQLFKCHARGTWDTRTSNQVGTIP